MAAAGEGAEHQVHRGEGAECRVRRGEGAESGVGRGEGAERRVHRGEGAERWVPQGRGGRVPGATQQPLLALPAPPLVTCRCPASVWKGRGQAAREPLAPAGLSEELGVEHKVASVRPCSPPASPRQKDRSGHRWRGSEVRACAESSLAWPRSPNTTTSGRDAGQRL